MSIFIHEVDTALDRYTMDDGATVAIGYDADIPHPCDDGDTWRGTAIAQVGARHGVYGDASLLDRGTPGVHRFELTASSTGHPSFLVAVGPEFWETTGLEPSEDRAHRWAAALVTEHVSWCDGDVYLWEITPAGGDSYTVGGLYGDYGRGYTRADAARTYAEIADH